MEVRKDKKKLEAIPQKAQTPPPTKKEVYYGFNSRKIRGHQRNKEETPGGTPKPQL